MSVRLSEGVDQDCSRSILADQHSINQYAYSKWSTILIVLFLLADIRVQWSGYCGHGRQRLRGDRE